MLGKVGSPSNTILTSRVSLRIFSLCLAIVRMSLADCFLVLMFLLDFSLFNFGVFSVSSCLEEENRPDWLEVYPAGKAAFDSASLV